MKRAPTSNPGPFSLFTYLTHFPSNTSCGKGFSKIDSKLSAICISNPQLNDHLLCWRGFMDFKGHLVHSSAH